MDSIFITKLIASFVIGGAWAIGVTLSADRLGSKVGGLLAALPSTTLFSLFFLAWVYTPTFASAATTIMPISLAIENVFVLIYIALAERGLFIALGASLVLWFTGAFFVVSQKFTNVGVGFFAYVVTIVGVYYLVEYVLHVPSVSGVKLTYSPKAIFLRGILSGSIIGFAVIMGKIGGPLLGGVFSVFPAMFISTIIITYFSRGWKFSAATMKSALLGLVTVMVHTLMVRVTYVPLGIWWGTLVSTLVSFTTGYIIYRIGIKKLR